MLTYFQRHFKLRQSSNGWYRFTNPLDSKSKSKGDDTMAVNFQTGVVKCFRTGYFARLQVFIRDYEGISYREAGDILGDWRPVQVRHTEKIKHKVRLPEGFKSLAYGDCSLGIRARTYLTKRGFDVDLLDSIGVGYCITGQYLGHIIIPYKIRGKLEYWTARSYIGGMRYMNPPANTFNVGKSELIFNEDALYLCDDVFAGEGAFDAMTAGESGIAFGGWSVSSAQRRKLLYAPYKRLIVMPDRGFYHQATRTFAFLLGHKELVILNPEILDGDDPNDWGYEGIMALTDFAEPQKFSTLLDL